MAPRMGLLRQAQGSPPGASATGSLGCWVNWGGGRADQAEVLLSSIILCAWTTTFRSWVQGSLTEEGKGLTGPRKGGLGEGGEDTARGRENADLTRVHSALRADEAEPQWDALCTPGCTA